MAITRVTALPQEPPRGDDEQYREGQKLNGTQVPNAVLDQLDRNWLGRKNLRCSENVSAEFYTVSDLVDRVERGLRERAALTAIDEGMALLTYRVEWTQGPLGAADLGGNRDDDPRVIPWDPSVAPEDGTALLTATLTGLGIGMISRPADPTENGVPR